MDNSKKSVLIHLDGEQADVSVRADQFNVISLKAFGT